MTSFGVNAAGMTDQGRIRRMNMDCFLVNRTLNLYAVADGIESAPYSEMASRMAVEQLEKMIKELDFSNDATPPFDDHPGLPLQARALKYAFREVNRVVHQFSQTDRKYNGMGTTLTAIWIDQGRVYGSHVGDSRAYLIRRDMPQHLTSDHTSLSDRSPDRARDIEQYEEIMHTSEHELSRAIGINPDVQVQLAGGASAVGDHFVLCTDGLYGQLRDFEIVEIATKNTPQLACRKLIHAANQAGGKDNVAVVVVSLE